MRNRSRFGARGRHGSPRFQNKPKRPSFSYGQSTGRTTRGRKAVQPLPLSQLVKKASASQEEAYIPKHTFSDFKISETLLKNVIEKGYSIPTPIQDQTIPTVLEGRDLIGIANTGTGKTAAFLIPLIEKVFLNKEKESVLIVAPTRELSVQIYDEFRSFSRGLQIYGVNCNGGSHLEFQRKELRKKPHFVIGTPGRLKDHVKSGYLNLSEFETVVLDEADLMIDIGFIHDIKFFISQLPEKRQSLFFSATVSEKEKEVLKTFVTNPVTVSVKKQETAEMVDQDVVKISDTSKKVDVLHDLLIQEEFEKVLIFGRSKWSVQKLADELIGRGFKVDAIHGNKKQNQRQRALDSFHRNDIKILLATDVVSRGIDVENVTHVINYDMPESYEDYVHRIGRTGRAGKTGVALTFLDE